MEALKKMTGATMTGIGVVVAAYFIINPFLPESFDVMSV